MRRLVLLVLLLAVPAIAVGPGIVGATGTPRTPDAQSAPAQKHASKPCAKKTKKKAARCKPAAHHKPTPTPTRKKKQPKATAAPVHTATPTPTATLIPTATVTPTVTLTPTPEPSTAQIKVESEVARGYVTAFLVCGLPNGVTAFFSPNPVTSGSDSASPTGSSARSTLTLSTTWQVGPGQYGLEVWAEYIDSNGSLSNGAPGGTLVPRAVLLTVGQSHRTTVSATDAVPAANFQHCSPLPSTFQPKPTPTVDPSKVVVSTSVSDAHPVAGESVAVIAKISYGGNPIPNVPVHIAWFGPRPIEPCDTTTDLQGFASCSRVNLNPLPNQTVTVQVTARYDGYTYTSYTAYYT
jgi:hypothetical protein